MFKRYLQIALLTLTRHKGYALINIIGLGVGIACTVLIFLLVRHETGFDRFHANSNRLYRAWVHEDHGDVQITDVTTPIILAPTLKSNFPEIEQVVRVDTFNEYLRRGDIAFAERMHLVDPSFLEVFSFQWLRGDASTALTRVDGLVITPAVARKYFGESDPMGEVIEMRINGVYQPFTVTGIIAPPPQASSIQYQVLVPDNAAYHNERSLTSWFNVTVETYVLLRPDVDVAALETQINLFMHRTLGARYPAGHYQVHLQPMPSIHLDTSIRAGLEPTGSPLFPYILAAIGVLLLTVASINFVSLAIGRSTSRSTEVGIRKVVGAHRFQLMKQFWGEAMLMTLIAMILGLALAELTLPLFNRLSGRSLELAMDKELAALLVAVGLLVGFGAGSYPAAVLSGFRPVEVLKGKLSTPRGRNLLRGLVVSQFALAIVLISGSLVIKSQVTFLQNKDLGFEQENMLVIPLGSSGEEGQRFADIFADEVVSLPQISGVTAASFPPGDGQWQVGYRDNQDKLRQFFLNIVRPDFVSVMGMEIIQGRDFSPNSSSDAARALIVNEAFVHEYGWEQPLGQRLPGAAFPDHEVIGVVKDFNFMSLHEAVRPMMLVLDYAPLQAGIVDSVASSSSAPDMLVRLAPLVSQSTLEELGNAWRKMFPEEPFKYSFLADTLAAQYSEQLRLSEIVRVAALLAIFIACLGLFGLAALATERRTREIGVRKVMGGSVWSIVLLLTNDFSKLVMFANLIAWPVAYFSMERWLQNFAYRIDLTPLIFIGSGFIALFIAWATVGSIAAKAASAKPVLALRYE